MKIFQKFTSLESSGGYCLLLATAIALLWTNSPFKESYNSLVNSTFVFKINPISLTISLIDSINEGLMTLFFFLVVLEIKRELLAGELNSAKKAILPAIAALGGMIVPAIFYIVLNWGNEINLRGWAIPTATDIAFSLAVLSLLNHRIPVSLKIFLTALAIFDDLGAILIIAVFYVQSINWLGLAFAGFLEIVLILFNVLEIVSPVLYGLFGILIWWSLFISGIHPTLAGVLVALTVPLKTRRRPHLRPLNDLEKRLHPWIIFLVLPIFAFVNAGISLENFFGSLLSPVSLGIVLGLFLGKQLGVLSFCWLAIRSKLAELPAGIHWKNLYGISLLCGIGFTMSFFIGFLSFENVFLTHQNYLRSGILLGSFLSAICGYLWLRFCGIDYLHNKL